MDTEVKKIVEKQYARAKELLANNKDKLTQLADQLLEKEVIFKEDLVKIFGKRPFEKDELLNMEEDKKKEKSTDLETDADPKTVVPATAVDENGASDKVETESSVEVSDSDITKKE
jgi:cell division protease FtsH